MTDRRVTPANGRVAATELRGVVEAETYVDGDMRRVAVPVLDVIAAPGATALERQLMYGDRFRVLDHDNGFAFGQADRGGYVGWVRADRLGAWRAPTHVIETRASLLFSAPDIKSPTPELISLGAFVTVVDEVGPLAQLADGLFIPKTHLRPVDQPEADPVTVAERLIGTPYLWGGNSAEGIDCSGLVQIALMACGIDCPGDSDQQREAFPAVLDVQRGDLLFWVGHVAMAVDGDTLIHANAHAMAVTYEDREACIARIKAAEGKDVLKIARPMEPK